MKLKETNKYDDIIHLSRPEWGKRAKMSAYDRAAQFSPFAALTGFDAAIEETGRLTDRRIELDEGGKALLNDRMNQVLAVLHTQPKVKITWFCYDARKAGGRYITTVGQLKKVDLSRGALLLLDGRSIPLGEVFDIGLEEPSNL